jgi:hypothetical protein
VTLPGQTGFAIPMTFAVSGLALRTLQDRGGTKINAPSWHPL